MSLRAPARDDALAVSHLSTLISSTGSLAQILHELRSSPLWSPPPPRRPPPSLLDQPDPLDNLLLTVALESSSWREDALQIFCALLERGADPLGRNFEGRRVEWELEGRGEEFKEEWERAREARRTSNEYEMPPDMKKDLDELYETYLVLLQEEDEMREEAERARKVAELAQKKVLPPPMTSRLSAEPSSRSPSRLGQGSPAPEGAAAKRPLTSRLPPPAPKRPRLSSEVDASTLPDYDDSTPHQEPTPEDIKPTLAPPTRPFRPFSASTSNSPAPPPSLPPGATATFIRISRLPPWITPQVLSHWLEYGAQVFATCPSPDILISMLSRGYYKKRMLGNKKPPRAISVELEKREGGEGGPEDGMGGGGEMEAVVAYGGREEAWRAKEGFDTMRVLPLWGEDPMVQVQLL